MFQIAYASLNYGDSTYTYKFRGVSLAVLAIQQLIIMCKHKKLIII